MTTPAPYARQLLQSDDDHEILMMTWRPGATCAPHDHGAAAGVIHVLTGAVVERRYHFDGRALVVLSERRVDAPAQVTIDAGVVHDMHAVGATTTVHVYRPRVQAMRVYDPAARATWTVPDDHGAWLPHAAVAGATLAPWGPA